MRLNMDKIVFENRSELDIIIDALQKALELTKDKNNRETIQELINKLDAMYTSW